MAPGTIIVDLAAETGGNVEGSKPGEIVETAGGVRIWGGKMSQVSCLSTHHSCIHEM